MGDSRFDVLDVLKGLFYFLKDKNVKIKSKTEFFHGLICDFSTRKEYRMFFRELQWQKRIFGYYSEQLGDYLWCLEMADQVIDQDGDYYLVLPKLGTSWRKHSRPHFHSKELALIEAMAEEMAIKLREEAAA